MEQNVFRKIHEIIEASSLTVAQKREFTEFFAQTKESALIPVLKLLESDTGWVEKLYANYRMKKDAMVTGDMAAWQDAIEKEKEELVEN